ncbi:MAG: Tfp pilus assembly protein PilN [Motiliproteus sp.]|jgi:Tfp pilus assembly protein PilN
MKQQINLYVKRERVKTPVSAQTVLLLVLGVMLLLVTVGVRETQGLSQLKQEVAALKQQNAALATKIEILLESKRPKNELPALRQTRDQLHQELSARRHFGELLVEMVPPGSGIFSPLFIGLSEQVVAGVWLTRIQASQNGAKITLQGHAHNATLMPKYMKRLGRTSAYQNAQFDQFELTEAPSGIGFMLSGSRPKGERADG